MLELVGTPEDRFSRVAVHIVIVLLQRGALSTLCVYYFNKVIEVIPFMQNTSLAL